jgi:transcriptional regulator with XRE-family HTH domain
MDADSVVSVLRRRRTSLGVTLRRLSRTVGCSDSAICAWENGRRHPSPATLTRWADALGCDLMVVARDGAELDVDEVAVARAVAGEQVALTREERAEAMARLERQGLTAKEIGSRLGLSTRQIQRHRSSTVSYTSVGYDAVKHRETSNTSDSEATVVA